MVHGSAVPLSLGLKGLSRWMWWCHKCLHCTSLPKAYMQGSEPCLSSILYHILGIYT